MGVLQRMRGAFAQVSKGRQPGGLMYGTFAPSESGTTVSDESAMRYAAVQACVRVLSEDVAALPLHVYKRLPDGGKERARSHPLYHILHDSPNREMTSVAFKEAMMVNLLMGGNGYAYIEYDNAGRVMGLWPLLYSEVSVYRNGDGAIRYNIAGRTFMPGEILHITGLSYDGLLGLSPIAYARESIGLGVAAEKFGARFFSRGTHLGGVIESPVGQPLTDAQFERTTKLFASMFKGMENAHGIPYLEGGATYKPIGIAPEDAQFLETRKYQRGEIASIFRVPPHLIGDLDRATFSNIEHQDQAYLQRSLLPWLTRIEQSMRMRLLLPGERETYVIEHDTGSFLKGDTKSRMGSYAVAIQNGIMTPNEARAKENLNPRPGGDNILLPMNMTQGGTDPDRAQRTAHNCAEHRDDDLLHYTLETLGVTREQHDALVQAFANWLRPQAANIERLAQRIVGTRSAPDTEALTEAVEQYYSALPDEMPEDVMDAVDTISKRAFERVRGQISQSKGLTDDWYQNQMRAYGADMGKRLKDANRDEIGRIITRNDESDLLKPLAAGLALWGTKRALTMARNELSMAVNGMLLNGYKRAGYTGRWRARAGECPACIALNGRTVTTLKPPLHKGCTCTVELGEKQ